MPALFEDFGEWNVNRGILGFEDPAFYFAEAGCGRRRERLARLTARC
jgi:hypothetical protein